MNQSTIRLPAPNQRGEMPLETAITRRRSIRNFTPELITLSQLSQILWATQGVIANSGGFRTAPSAGATYPLDLFMVCGANSVDPIKAGVYRYIVDSHSLIRHLEGDVRRELARAALGQDCIYEAPVDIVICAEYERTTIRYGTRGEKYVHMEVGHTAQNLYLQATALGLGTVVIGAFHDEQVREVLKLEKRCKPLYIMPVGKPS